MKDETNCGYDGWKVGLMEARWIEMEDERLQKEKAESWKVRRKGDGTDG